MMTEIFLSLFILLLFHYLFFLFEIFAGLFELEKTTYSRAIQNEFISIIIAFRNERDIILKSLKSIETIDYPEDKFETIYVNDNSDDGSPELLRESIRKKNINVIDAPLIADEMAHKKKAVRYALTFAKGEIIVTSDADCIHPRNWLNVLIPTFDTQTGFVSGPVEFDDDGTLFGKIQKLEFMGLIIAGAGLIGVGKPAICNAANLAYRKTAFQEAGGYEGQMNLSSGDDELLMQQISRKTNYKVKFCFDKKSVVKTAANKNLSQFYNQRKRWASKGFFYADKLFIARLVLIFFFYLSLIASVIFGFTVSNLFLIYLLSALLLKIALEFLIIKKGNSRLFNSPVTKYFFIAELFQIPYIIFASIGGVFGNYKWKDRKIKR
ncbi:MAG: hypothetical protein CO127_09910 [Ignavibacteria bacterium CG_4_9_14_3_um_filter_36_18]|nr:glycosyltransferase [Ignavibacteria bacterium]PJA99770.1 MAG: hypothetical protein CO127_09910 [Ignavibacteria bacterium CG_4_9_14_3_um_filter_36_18]